MINGGKSSILIVDDKTANIEELSKILMDDYIVYTVLSGTGAIEKAISLLPDVILLDADLADMDGYDVLVALKEKEEIRAIPVVFIREQVDAAEEEKGLKLGAADYITKPFSAAIVEVRVRNQIKILERVHALEDANAANRAKSDYLSTMSHEMRTPVNTIIGITAIGRKEASLEEKNRALNKIGDVSTHLLGVINDVLDMAKIEAGKLSLSPIEFDFEEMLRRVLTIIGFRADEKRQTITCDIDSAIPPYLIGDDQRLAQVLINLLSNAVKFTPNGGKILLKAALLKEKDNTCTIRVEVADNGIGISAKQQESLFNAFEQVSNSTFREYGGTGLGLAITKRIVELMGGSIWVESEQDKGATFIFTIKARSGKKKAKKADTFWTATEQSPDKEQTSRYDFSGHTVLVADDYEINREMVAAMLEDTGVFIDFAVDGKAASMRFYVNPEKYSLILMDINMPVMDGIEATTQIRRYDHPWAKEVPIIAMTGEVFAEDIKKCLDAGMDDHIGKPFDPDNVLEVLRKHLRQPGAKTKPAGDFGIAWDEGLLTGNVMVDSQHFELFEKVGHLAKLCREGKDVAELGDTLNFLVNYAVRHFNAEEELMIEYSYTGYKKHMRLHREFEATVGVLVQKFNESGSTSELSGEVNKTIVAWLIEHIKHEDRKMVDFIRSV